MRKQPKQVRSKLTVDALIEATARLIAERGLIRITTNHIAERAGVSIGSLYQYFDGMDSLLKALLDKSGADASMFADHHLKSMPGADMRTTAHS